MLKLAGELIEGQLADHIARLDAHTKNILETLKTGEYYGATPHGPPLSTAMTANRLHAMPFLVARDITIDRIAIQVTALAAGASARLGIYNLGTNLTPGTLLLDAGEVSVATTGIKAIVIDQALTKGIYFLVVVTDGTPSTYAFDESGDPLTVQLGYSSTYFLRTRHGYYKSHTYAALPDPFGTASDLGTFNCPAVVVRIASLD